MVLVTYEILYPCTSADPSLQHPPSVGAVEMAPSGKGGKLCMQDVASQWPFEGSFHWRAMYSPASEPHVYLDIPDPAMALPVQQDGSVQLRALPLGHLLQGVPSAAPAGEQWAWSPAQLAAWQEQRGGSGAEGAGGGSQRQQAEGSSSREGSSSSGEGSSSSGEEGGGEAWQHLDGGFQEGGPSIGASKGTFAEAAEEGLASAAAAAAAARDAAGEAAGAAFSAAKRLVTGWGAAMKGMLGSKKGEGAALE